MRIKILLRKLICKIIKKFQNTLTKRDFWGTEVCETVWKDEVISEEELEELRKVLEELGESDRRDN